MHDPMTVAHEIHLGPKKRKNGNYRSPFITIWHLDPEKDGTDDSCGWFKRARHVDQKKLEEVSKEFLFNYKHNYWFDANGYRQFSTPGLVLNMFTTSLWIHYNRNRKKSDKFLRKHLHSILHFAENPTDSIGDTITRKFGGEINEETIRSLAATVYTYIVRAELKWWQHPRWHIHHWKIQFHPWQQLKRRYWDKCAICGKRGFKSSAISDWSGTNRWHQHCDRTAKNPMDVENDLHI